MKILIVSFAFLPQTGGIEVVSDFLAREFVELGHEVCVITQVEDRENKTPPKKYRIVRNPGRMEAIRLHRWCDVCLHSNISLQMLWPLIFVRRPWFIVHHTWLGPFGAPRRVDKLKQFLLRFGHSISISRAMADHLKVPSVVLGNPYDAETFRLVSGKILERDIIFVGRLVPDKGVDVLLNAVAKMKVHADVTIVGTGESMLELKHRSTQLGLLERVDFVGAVRGASLASLMNSARVIAIPSTWQEPFGLVALEGIACGCIAVGSNGGGLPDAIGKCGITFGNGNVLELASALDRALSEPEIAQLCNENRKEHLEKFHPRTVAASYIRLFESVLGGRKVPDDRSASSSNTPRGSTL